MNAIKMEQNIKYSIVLPVLDGQETLEALLPEYLKIDRDDFEIVISDNQSTDKTWDIINSFQDRRIKAVQTTSRIPFGANLNFAYSHASGLWQHHIGDDDWMLPCRMTVYDMILKCHPNAGLIISPCLRYHWPSYNDAKLANALDPFSFTGNLECASGMEMFERWVRRIYFGPGLSFLASQDTLSKVYHKSGFYSTNSHAEAFLARACSISSELVCRIDYPLGIVGRHSKSIGTQSFTSESDKILSTHVKNSDPDPFLLAPWQFKGYHPWSVDGLLLLDKYYDGVSAISDDELGHWSISSLSELDDLRIKKQVEREDVEQFFEGIRKTSDKTRKIFWTRSLPPKEEVLFEAYNHELRKLPFILKIERKLWQNSRFCNAVRTLFRPQEPSIQEDIKLLRVHSATRIHGDSIGVHSIVDLANQFDQLFSPSVIKNLSRRLEQ